MALEPVSGSSSQFVQQGSVDWVQLANTSLTFPVPVLARLAAADINPLTTTVIRKMSSNFHMSKDGHSRLIEALKILPSFSSIGNAIWFGFGIKHIVRSLAETSEGLNSIALCGCLSELHPPKACASILMELVRVCGALEIFSPSSEQWLKLVAACSGVLRPTNFSSVAGHFMSYHSRDWTIGTMEQYEDVAKALNAVGLVSSGSLDSITLAGGRSCGWIAAFAYRFLGLDVEIRNTEGEVMYRSTDREEHTRIRVIYSKSQLDGLQISHTTYFITTIHQLFTTHRDKYDTVMSGTVPWKECLRSVFGVSASQLLSTEANLGLLIQLSARVFDGLAKAEPSNIFSAKKRQTWFAYQPGQRGRGFVLSATEWFPDLVSLQEQPEFQAASFLTLDAAAAKYNHQLQHIATLCHGGHPVPRSHCLATLAETITFLIWNLSGIESPVELNPYRFGLQFIYEYVAVGGDCDRMFVQGIQHQDGSAGTIEHLVSLLDMASVYHTAQFLFTTDLYPQMTTAFSATSRGGLCFYLGILRGTTDALEMDRPSLDRPDAATLLHVVPGRIENRTGRAYSHILDKTGRRSTAGIFDLKATNHSFIVPAEYSRSYESDPPKTLAAFDGDLAANTGNTDLTTGLIVQESPQGLLVDFCFSCALGKCYVGPYTLFREVAFGSGLVYCPHRNCSHLEPPFDNILVVDGEGGLPVQPSQDKIYVYRLTGNSVARCVGLLVDKDSWDDPVILRGRECIPCCIAAARRMEQRPVFIIL